MNNLEKMNPRQLRALAWSLRKGGALANPATLGADDLDATIALAEQVDDREALALYVPHRLGRRGLTHSASLILMAQDLYAIYTKRLWEEAAYTTFAEWVSAEFSPQPYGKDYNTVMAMVRIISLYQVEYGWSVAKMAMAGKAKMERALATAKATQQDGRINEDLEYALLDPEVGHRQVLEDFEARRAARGAWPSDATGPAFTSSRSPTYQAYSDSGDLVVWIPMGGKDADIAIKLGTLRFDADEAEPWLSALLHRSGVKVS